MHTPPILCVSPAPRPLSAVIETGGAKTWAVPAGATQVAFPLRGAPGDALAGKYPLADRMLAVGEGGAGGLPGPRPAGPGGNADPPRIGRFARDGGAALGDRAGRGARLAGRGYVRARFGGVPVLIAPELAAQIRAVREEQP